MDARRRTALLNPPWGEWPPGRPCKVMDEPGPETRSQARQAAKVAWAKMIRKVYEVDPLACPECASQMRVIALMTLTAWRARKPAARLPSPPRHRLRPP